MIPLSNIVKHNIPLFEVHDKHRESIAGPVAQNAHPREPRRAYGAPLDSIEARPFYPAGISWHEMWEVLLSDQCHPMTRN